MKNAGNIKGTEHETHFVETGSAVSTKGDHCTDQKINTSTLFTEIFFFFKKGTKLLYQKKAYWGVRTL